MTDRKFIKKPDFETMKNKFVDKQKRYREGYNYARSLGVPRWLALTLRHRPKEVIEQYAKIYHEKKREIEEQLES